MADSDGEIRIKVGLDSEGFYKDLDKLKNQLKAKTEQLENMRKSYAGFTSGEIKTKEQIRLEEELNNVLKKREEIQAKLNDTMSKRNPELIQQIEDIDRYIPKIKSNLDKVKLRPENTQSVRNLANDIRLAEKQANDLNTSIILNKEKLNTRLELMNKRMQMQELAIEERTNREKTRLAERAARDQARIVERAAKEQARIAERAAREQAKAHERASKNLKGAFSGLLSPIKSASDAVFAFGKRIIALGAAVLVFQIIRSGFRQFRDYLLGVLQTNSQFVTSLNQIKSNLMVAFYPIYQYILPALNNLMQALVKASAYFAQFMSMITGRSIQDSQAGAKALYERTQAMKASAGASRESASASNDNAKSVKDEKAAFDKLGKSIKGSKKELASFDKLIVLNQNKEKSPKEPKVKTPKSDGSDGFVFSPTTAFDSNYDNILNFWKGLGDVIDRIKNKAIELGGAFQQGFNFGFVDNNLGELQTKISKIGEHLNEIFTDPEVQENANNAMIAIVTAWGAWAGAFVSIGITIAKAWIGGFEKFLDENKDQIKEDLKKLFIIEIDWANFQVQFANAVANIYSVFGGEAAQKIVSDALTIIYNIFVRGFLQLAQVVLDIVKVIFQPFIDYQEEIKKALEGTLDGISTITGAVKDIIVDFFDYIEKTYNESFKPILEKLGEIWSDVFGMIVENYNKYVNPTLKNIGDKLTDLGQKHIKPFLDTLSDMWKSFKEFIIPVLDKLWEFLKPFVSWIVEEIFKKITDSINFFVDIVSNSIGTLIDLFDGFAKILGGFFDVIVGLFSGDWQKVWDGAGKIVDGFKDIFKVAINFIIDGLNSLIDGFRNGLNTIINNINKFIGIDIPDWIPGIGGRHFGFSIPNIPDSFARIPKLAQGAVLQGGNPMLAYLNDQPRGQVNVETPLKTMVEAFNQALRNNNYNNSGNVTIEATGDVSQLIQFLSFKLKQHDQRIGTSLVTGDVWI